MAIQYSNNNATAQCLACFDLQGNGDLLALQCLQRNIHCFVSKIHCLTNQNKPDNGQWHRVSQSTVWPFVFYLLEIFLY